MAHAWTVGQCIVYTEIELLLLIFPFIHFFLSNFQTLNIFVTLFSETVRPRRLKLGALVDNRWMCRVYRNQAAAAFLSLFLHFSFSPTSKFFATLFSRTLRPRRLKLGTHVENGQLYLLYRNQAAGAYWSLYFFIFYSLQFSNIKIYRHIFLSNCAA